MKTTHLFLTMIFAIFFSSCLTRSYYQVYKTTPNEKLKMNENAIVYEDENCKISYNLWDEGGNIGFTFYNKTNENIYLNLDESFFVLNGVSNDYYKNRIMTSSTNSAVTSTKSSTISKSETGINYSNLIQTNQIGAINGVAMTVSSEFSVSYNEKKIICIPFHTSKTITEFKISQSLFRDCDLYKYPTKSLIKTRYFTKTESPFVFSNRISYAVGSNKSVDIENEFYVSEITNYPENEITETRYNEYCNETSDLTSTKSFKISSPDKFFIKYFYGQFDYFSH
jgi:hypothetical protein